MPTPLPDALVAAVAAQLASAIPSAVVERDRRAPVDTDRETLPRLVVNFDGIEADTAQEPGYTHYRLAFSVSGYAGGATDILAAQALYSLHAATVAALAAWTPAAVGLGNAEELGGEFAVLSADQGEKPAGDFLARFNALAVTATGNPYTP